MPEVEALLDDLVHRDHVGKVYAIPAPQPPCGGALEDALALWPSDQPTHHRILLDESMVWATVWPTEADAEAVVTAYQEGREACSTPVEADTVDYPLGSKAMIELDQITITTEVAPGWQGVRSVAIGGFDNGGAQSGEYSELRMYARKGNLVVATEWHGFNGLNPASRAQPQLSDAQTVMFTVLKLLG